MLFLLSLRLSMCVLVNPCRFLGAVMKAAQSRPVLCGLVASLMLLQPKTLLGRKSVRKGVATGFCCTSQSPLEAASVHQPGVELLLAAPVAVLVCSKQPFYEEADGLGKGRLDRLQGAALTPW